MEANEVTRERFLSTRDGLELCYRRRGADGAGRTPLLVPALSWLADDFEQRLTGRPLVFHDVRGRGRSARVDEMSRLGLERDVDDTEELRVALEEEDAAFARIDLFGWSYYGALALRYALREPERVRRIVLVGPSPPRLTPWFGDFLDAFARRMDLERLQALGRDKRAGLNERDPLEYGRRVNDLYHRAYVVDPTVLETMRSDPCVAPNADAERVNDQSRRVIEKLGDYDWRDEFRGLDVPVLLLHGREDPVVLGGSEEWAGCLPHCRLEILEGIGHMPWLEDPVPFYSRIEAFLDTAE